MEKKAAGGKNSTSNLMSSLLKETTIEHFMECNDANMKLPPFHIYLKEKSDEIGEIPERIANRGGIESSYCHQIFKGSRMPSRDKVVQLAFGLSFDLEKTQKLLKVAQYSPLYPRIKRDAVLIFCINRKRSMMETQELLHELELKLLGGERE